MKPVQIRQFDPGLDVGALADLRQRLNATRWPDNLPDGWEQGVDPTWLRELCAHWSTHVEKTLDGAGLQARLRAVENLLVELEPGLVIHVARRRSISGTGIPIVLTHGWPGAFTDYLAAAADLADSDSSSPQFDVILPSLPGYGFSTRPHRAFPYIVVGDLWARLMRALGYERYVAGGSDFGSGVATCLASQHPDVTAGLHLSTLELAPSIAPGDASLTADERRWLEHEGDWWDTEGGYKGISATKPATLTYGLTDSPVGLAAWIGEKWWSWSDPTDRADGCLPERTTEALLDVLTLYWSTKCIGPSLLDYWDNRVHPRVWTATDRIMTPTGVAAFTDPAGTPPKQWWERLYNVTHWAPQTRGGHFGPAEQPAAFADDVRRFVETLGI